MKSKSKHRCCRIRQTNVSVDKNAPRYRNRGMKRNGNGGGGAEYDDDDHEKEENDEDRPSPSSSMGYRLFGFDFDFNFRSHFQQQIIQKERTHTAPNHLLLNAFNKRLF